MLRLRMIPIGLVLAVRGCLLVHRVLEGSWYLEQVDELCELLLPVSQDPISRWPQDHAELVSIYQRSEFSGCQQCSMMPHCHAEKERCTSDKLASQASHLSHGWVSC